MNNYRRQFFIGQPAQFWAGSLILEPLIAAKAKERQAEAGGDRKSANVKSLRENSHEAIDRGRTDESLAQIAGIGDIEDGPNLDNPKLGTPAQQKSRGDESPALYSVYA